jgi:hypothetical protein
MRLNAPSDFLGHLEVGAQGVDELHLTRRFAGGARELGARHQDGQRLGTRDGDVEPIRAEQEFEAARGVVR